jgi:hypothetical protein
MKKDLWGFRGTVENSPRKILSCKRCKSRKGTMERKVVSG